MSFEKDYIKIIAFAKKRISENNLTLDPGDLVNDAYLALFDKPYSLGLYLKEIKNLSYNKPSTIQLGVKAEKQVIRGEQCCRKCKEVKSVCEFYIKKNVWEYVSGTCKTCHLKICADWRNRNKEKCREYKKGAYEKYSSKQRDYRIKNRQEINKKRREKYEKEKGSKEYFALLESRKIMYQEKKSAHTGLVSVISIE